MLCSDYHIINTFWLAVFILYRYLGLAVRSQEIKRSVLSYFCKTLA